MPNFLLVFHELEISLFSSSAARSMKLLDSVQHDRALAIATSLDPHLTDRTHEVIQL